MSKHLKLGGDPAAEAWTLADDADIGLVQKEIDAAMAGGKTTRVRVVIARGQTGDLLVNGRALEAAVVWETDPSQPSFSIID